jgi:hypothetical protein
VQEWDELVEARPYVRPPSAYSAPGDDLLAAEPFADPAPAESPTPPSEQRITMSVPLIIFVAVALAFVLLLIGAILYLCLRRNRRLHRRHVPKNEFSTTTASGLFVRPPLALAERHAL